MGVTIKRGPQGGPRQSVLDALWVYPARRGKMSLYILKESTGTMYRVLDYNPATKTMVLARLDKKGSKFKSKFTEQANEDYVPVWRAGE